MSNLDLEVTELEDIEIKNNVNGVSDYFRFLYYKKIKLRYPMSSENRTRLGTILKTEVTDVLILKGLTESKHIKEFLIWFFETIDQKFWHLHLLGRFASSYVKQYAITQIKQKEQIVDNILEKKKEEQTFLEYVGRGWFDAELTKKQYWLGILWRSKHLKENELKELSVWKQEHYSEEVISRLKRWRQEMKEVDLNVTVLFCKEMAKSRNQPLIEFLKEFGRMNSKHLFSEKELIR